MKNPFTEALELVQQHSGTGGQVALAKCILSLYNQNHAFSLGEVLGPLDERYSNLVLAMIKNYLSRGETDELLLAGRYVIENFPRLLELSNAMTEARATVMVKWEQLRETEMRRLYPEEYQ